MLRARSPLKRTGKRIKCKFCDERFEKQSSRHVTCNSDECSKKQKRVATEEDFLFRRRTSPVLCTVCDLPIKVKRFRKHPKCSKREAADKKRLERATQKIRDQKIAAHKSSKPPRQKDRVSPRMEELKCAVSLRRTF